MNYLILFLFVFIFVINNVSGSEFKLQTLENENSVCNDGNNANYWIANQKADKWLIHLPGGGGAWDDKTFINRDKNKKQSIKKVNNFSSSVSKPISSFIRVSKHTTSKFA